jgi:hypothetical protein
MTVSVKRSSAREGLRDRQILSTTPGKPPKVFCHKEVQERRFAFVIGRFKLAV